VSDEVAMRAIWFVLVTLLLLPPHGGAHGSGAPVGTRTPFGMVFTPEKPLLCGACSPS